MKTYLIPSLLFALLISMTFLNCEKEEGPVVETPTVITLSNLAIYEKLPVGIAVGELSTDITAAGIKYKLIAGEGDTDNGEFVIDKNYLETKTSLLFAVGESRTVRIQVINDTKTFEKVFTITVKEFSGAYPSISSPSFADNELMPNNFGADNGNVSPDLNILDIPGNTVSMVLEMIDIDFSDFGHWLVWNIDPNKTSISKNQNWTGGTVVGTVYTGPYPPTEHRYQITVYFLDSELSLSNSESKKVQEEIIGKTIAQATMIGRYTP